jgi:hypothetical protein
MMTIRPEQMKTLSEVEIQKFVDRTITQLRASFPEEVGMIPEAQLHATIRKSIDVASTYGITDEVDVQRYIEYVVRYGPDFDTNATIPWAGEILRNREMTGTDKMNLIDDYDLFTHLARP